MAALRRPLAMVAVMAVRLPLLTARIHDAFDVLVGLAALLALRWAA